MYKTYFQEDEVICRKGTGETSGWVWIAFQNVNVEVTKSVKTDQIEFCQLDQKRSRKGERKLRGYLVLKVLQIGMKVSQEERAQQSQRQWTVSQIHSANWTLGLSNMKNIIKQCKGVEWRCRQCWCGYKLAWLFYITMWQNGIRLINIYIFDPVISLLGICPKKLSGTS